ncbi:sulfotransferase family 2 domain-containing protein [Poseidonocella sedimentorum]|uniref:Sulfotransferase family protein n=1 Tax=Poseidonocella sedimentorum TaxID=871652 RepID=A0A1I6CTB6_9RHOB|nr:sulfotransferase family 2 domain-containing protein [Poseidonocella sedimentorum]SFQ96391.1 Sulfotransferase family protein [Poseidonocella sedimentorum]
MIISPGRRYIFIHIPKTGGTSMALALEARAMKDDILIGDTPKAIRRRRKLRAFDPENRLSKHARLADLTGLLPQGEIADMLIFTLVRNPWDRLVSYYHWLRQQRFDHPARRIAQTHDFAAFLAHPSIARSIAEAPTSAYLTDAAGRAAPALCLRLEHLTEDIAPLSEHLGFRPEIPLTNRSDRPNDYRACYTDETANHVARLCAEDIARFTYRFDP